MNKGDGTKIAIKFTQPLVGDVSGNESAFTVSGKELKWVDGPDNNRPLVDKEYEIKDVGKKGMSLIQFTDNLGETVFNIDEYSFNLNLMNYAVVKQGYISQHDTKTNIYDDIVIEITLQKSLIPEIEGLVLHLDATDSESVVCEDTPIIDTDGLVLYLNADEVVIDNE